MENIKVNHQFEGEVKEVRITDERVYESVSELMLEAERLGDKIKKLILANFVDEFKKIQDKEWFDHDEFDKDVINNLKRSFKHKRIVSGTDYDEHFKNTNEMRRKEIRN